MLDKDIQKLKKIQSLIQKRPIPVNPYHYFEEPKMTKLSELNNFRENNIRGINWDALSTNTNKFAIDSLISRLREINWKLFNIFQPKENKEYLMNSLLDTESYSRRGYFTDSHNKHIDEYVKKNIQGTVFANSNDIDFLKKNVNGTNFWDALSINKNRRALDLLIENYKQINWEYFIKYQPVENKEYVLNSLLLLGYDTGSDSLQQNTLHNTGANNYVSPYLHLLEGRASTALDFINLRRIIHNINWDALSTNTDPRAVEILFANIPKVNLELFNAFQSDDDKILMKREIDRILYEKLRTKYNR